MCVAGICPTCRVDYSQFPSVDEMADMVVREYASMTSIRTVDRNMNPVPSSSDLVLQKKLARMQMEINSATHAAEQAAS